MRLTRWMSSIYVGCLYLLFTLLAPSKPAWAQGFDSADGVNGVDDSKVFALFGTNFSFARKIDASGHMGYGNIGASFLYCDVNANQTQKVTVFSKDTPLLDWRTSGFRDTLGSQNGDFRLVVLPGGGVGAQQVLVSGVPYNLNVDLSGKLAVNVSPTFAVSHDFGTVEFKLPFTDKTIKRKIGVQELSLTLDATVDVTQTAKGPISMSFAGSGIDFVGQLDFSTTTELSRAIKLAKVGALGVKLSPKIVGTGTLDFGKSAYIANAHPTFTNLQGSATSNISKLDINVGGKIVVELSFTFGKEFDVVDVEIADLSSWTYQADPRNKVLYSR